MAKTSFYIDGFNLYHSIDALEKPHLKWLNLRALAESFLRPDDELHQVVYFSAHMVWEPQKFQRHRQFIAAIESVGVLPIISKFNLSKKFCRKCEQNSTFREEKQTDVGFAVRILADALTSGVERVIMLTADSDQVPTIAALRRLKPEVSILVAIPPGRLSIAGDLLRVAPEHREIKPGRLERCLFPRTVRNAQGKVVAHCPAIYDHPEGRAS